MEFSTLWQDQLFFIWDRFFPIVVKFIPIGYGIPTIFKTCKVEVHTRYLSYVWVFASTLGFSKIQICTYIRYLKKFLLTSIFYHAWLWVQTPMRNIQNDLKTILEMYLFCANWLYFSAGCSNSGSGLKINRDVRNKYTYDLLPSPQIDAH